VTDGGNQWTVAVMGVRWLDGACEDSLGAVAGPVAVVDIRVEALAGDAAVVPLVELRYVGEDGQIGGVSMVSGCTDPFDLLIEVPTGGVRIGQIALEVPSGGAGALTYGRVVGLSDDDFEPIASWVVPAYPR
jgi:hypothetical protein